MVGTLFAQCMWSRNMSTKSKSRKEARVEAVASAARRIETAAMKAMPKRDNERTKSSHQQDREKAKDATAKTAKLKASAKLPSRTKLSALDAAAQVLESCGEAMRAGDLVEAMAKRSLWTSPGGKTPDATLSAAMNREITKLGRASRFKKADRGLFESTGKRR